MAIAWRVWFDDGSEYNSRDHVWADCPDDGVLVRMLYYRDGSRQIQNGLDYYYQAPHFSGESIYGAGGSKDNIEKRYPDAVIKRGRWAPDDYYREIVDKAFASKPPGG